MRKRLVAILSVWAVAILVSVLVFILTENIVRFIVASVMSKIRKMLLTFSVSIAGSITVLVRYSDPVNFPITAYLNIGITIFMTLSTVYVTHFNL